MTFVPGVETDVFVSFADEDDAVLPGGAQGWVHTLADCVKKLLSQAGVKAPEVRTSLPGNIPASDRLKALSHSAGVLVVLSPAYLESPWLKDARCRETLLGIAATRPDSVFVAWKADVSGDEEPAELRRLRHHKFWRLEGEVSRTLGSPALVAGNMDAYYEVASDLATALAAELKRLRQPSPQPYPIPAVGAGTRVYLAEVTRDLEGPRQLVQRHLEQAGFDVVPRGRLPEAPGEMDRVVTESLAGCKAFVQLLGPIASDAGDAVPGGRPRRQLELAEQQRHNVDLAIIHWRDPAMDVSKVSAPEDRELLLRDTVRAESLEEFCQAVKRAATAPPPEQDGQVPAVYVDVVPRDQVPDVNRIFGRHKGIMWDFHDAGLKELKQTLRNVQAALIFWGKGRSGPVQNRYLTFRRHWAALKKKPDRLRIYDGPPSNKPEFEGANFPLIPGRQEDEPEELRLFIRDLKQHNE